MTVCSTTEELFELVKSAYKAGMYGYSDLCDQVVENLVNDFIKDRVVEKEYTEGSAVLDQGFVSIGPSVPSWVGSTHTLTDMTLPPQQQQYVAGVVPSYGAGMPWQVNSWSNQATSTASGFGTEAGRDLRAIHDEAAVISAGRDNPHSDVPQLTHPRWESPADNVMRPQEECSHIGGLVNTGHTTMRSDGSYSWHPYPLGMQTNVVTLSNTLTPDTSNLHCGDG